MSLFIIDYFMIPIHGVEYKLLNDQDIFNSVIKSCSCGYFYIARAFIKYFKQILPEPKFKYFIESTFSSACESIHSYEVIQYLLEKWHSYIADNVIIPKLYFMICSDTSFNMEIQLILNYLQLNGILNSEICIKIVNLIPSVKFDKNMIAALDWLLENRFNSEQLHLAIDDIFNIISDLISSHCIRKIKLFDKYIWLIAYPSITQFKQYIKNKGVVHLSKKYRNLSQYEEKFLKNYGLNIVSQENIFLCRLIGLGQVYKNLQ